MNDRCGGVIYNLIDLECGMGMDVVDYSKGCSLQEG